MQKELVHLLFSFTFFCLLTTNTYAANTGKYASNLKFIPIPSSILPTNDVRILYQDSDGYIWLPTYNGLVRYDGEMATLKRVEYPETREWLRLVPINPTYAPRTISDEALADCSIIGIPRLIIRTVD